MSQEKHQIAYQVIMGMPLAGQSTVRVASWKQGKCALMVTTSNVYNEVALFHKLKGREHSARNAITLRWKWDKSRYETRHA